MKLFTRVFQIVHLSVLLSIIEENCLTLRLEDHGNWCTKKDIIHMEK